MENNKKPLFQFNSGTGEFHTSKGVVLKLNPIGFVWIQDFQVRLKKSKPSIPTVRVDYGDGNFGEESSPEDSIYLQDTERWLENTNMETLKMMFNLGVENSPTREEKKHVQSYHAYIKGAIDAELVLSDTDIKYLWVASLIGGEEETQTLSQHIIGQTAPTQEGMDESADNFRGES